MEHILTECIDFQPAPVNSYSTSDISQLFHKVHPSSVQLSLAIPPWVGAMSTGQNAVILCNWGVKADMVLFAGNTV